MKHGLVIKYEGERTVEERLLPSTGTAGLQAAPMEDSLPWVGK